MAKYYGMVGYAVEEEVKPDVWKPVISERPYSGDVLQNSRRLENGESTNDNIAVNNKISIVADPFAYQHFFAIRYVTWMGARWKVTHVDVKSPRLILTIGGVYNGKKT